MTVARNLDLPKEIAKIVEKAPHYPEGNAIRVEITREADLEPVKKLVKVKVES